MKLKDGKFNFYFVVNMVNNKKHVVIINEFKG